MSAASRICSRVSPVDASTRSQSRFLISRAQSPKPVVWRSMKSRSSTLPSLPAASSASRSSAPNACHSARSPLMRTGRCRSERPGPGTREPAHVLRVLEANQAGLGQRVDREDLRAVPLRDLEGGQHPRVVGARVLSADHDQLGLVDVLEADRALADADGLGERGRGRLVAHVRAVGQVVGAVGAGEELIGVRRLVGGLARGVEDRLVGAVQAAQGLPDQLERLLPGDRLVVLGVAAANHGMDEPSLMAQPVVGVVPQVLDAVLREEVRHQVVGRRLLGHGLRAVLAELGVCRCDGSGSGQAQPWQSNPSTWLSLSSDRAVRVTPMLSMVRFMATAIPGIPAADCFGFPTSTSFSSMSAIGALRRRAMLLAYPQGRAPIKGRRRPSQRRSGSTFSP